MKKSEYLEKLFRPNLENSDRDQYICMDKNEPPFPAITENIFSNIDMSNLRQYPDPYKLYEKLSKFVGVNINNLLITQGSEQAIDFVFRTFLDEGDEVVYLNPSFAMFDVFAYQNRATIKYIEFDDLKISLKKVLNSISEKTSLFVLANPNNPTGSAFNLEEIRQIAEKCKNSDTIFLLDEAYFHFYHIDSISLLKEFPNLIITRTFSKALGVAGARVGYAISNFKNIELLRKWKPIDEINYLSMIIADKVLDNAEDILRRNIDQVKKWKDIFNNTTFQNIEYIPTEGNFILLKSSQYKKHKELLLEDKILPKMDFSQKFLKDCFRFSILDDQIMNKIVGVLQ